MSDIRDAWNLHLQRLDRADEEFAALFQPSKLPKMTFTATNPTGATDILKRRFLAAGERRREQEDDFSWTIPDLPADFGVSE